VLAARYAQLPAVMELLNRVFCFSETILSQCNTQDGGLRDYLKNKYGDSSDIRPWMPPGGYCLSRYQTDVARNIRDSEIAPRHLPAGTMAERYTWMTSLQRDVRDRREDHREAVSDASEVAEEIPMPGFDNQCPEGARPVERR
jgi:hypothetical protein